MAAYAPRTLALSETELQSLQALTGLPRESFEHSITRDNLHRWTLAQLKSITVALASRLPPRFTLRGAKAAQVAQLATALFEPPPARATPPAAAPAPRPSAFPSIPAPAAQSVVSPYHGYGQATSQMHQRSLTRRSAPTPSSSLSAAERETIKGALHPFYEEISTVAVSRVSALRMANSSHHQLRFQIDPQMHSQLESQSGTYGLLIRFFKDTNDIQWWNDFHVILNGKTVDTRSLQKKIRANPKYQSFVTPYPADIGTKVSSGTNMVEFYYHNWATTAILVIDFVKKRKQTDLMALVPLHKGAVSFSSAGGDEELEELKQKLPLTCPITMGRMVHPAKGRHCSHIHGFDLGTYISFCNQAQVWNCPICQKPLPFNQLVRDELITNILAATGEEVVSVELDSNGKWSLGNESIPIDAGEDSDGEANAKRSRSSDANMSARKAPRIDSLLRAAAAPSPNGSNGTSVPAAATPVRGETIIVVS